MEIRRKSFVLEKTGKRKRKDGRGKRRKSLTTEKTEKTEGFIFLLFALVIEGI